MTTPSIQHPSALIRYHVFILCILYYDRMMDGSLPESVVALSSDEEKVLISDMKLVSFYYGVIFALD